MSQAASPLSAKRRWPGRRSVALAAALVVVGLSAAGWWYATRIPSLRVLLTFQHKVGDVPFAFSDDGSLLVVEKRPAAGAQIWDTATGKLRCTLLLPESHALSFAVFSPDGRTIVISSRRWRPDALFEGQLAVYETSDGSVRARPDVPFDTVLCVHFSPDGSTLEVVGFDFAKVKDDPNLNPVRHSWETATWTETAVRPIPKVEGADLTFAAPYGQGLIRTSRESTIFSYVDLLAEGPPEPVTPLHDVASTPTGTHVVWFSADGRTIARGRTDLNLEFWDLESKRLRSTIKGSDFSGYESWLVTASVDPDTFLTTEFEGPPQRATAIFTFLSWFRRFSGIPKKYHSFVTVRDVQTGQPRAFLQDQYHPALSRDGKVLATAGYERSTITLWRMPSK